jgi:pyruvate kinase
MIQSSIPIVAKIEKGEAVDNLDEILNFADGIMVARGDLGAELKLEQVPTVQKLIIDVDDLGDHTYLYSKVR